MTLADIGRELGVERHLAGTYAREMPRMVIGKRIFVWRKDFDKWLKSKMILPAAPRHPAEKHALAQLDLGLFEPDGRLKRRRTMKEV